MSTDTSHSEHSHTPRSAVTATTPAPSTLGKDAIFHLLQNQRRRLVIRYLVENDVSVTDTVDMRTVAEQVTAWETDTTVRRISSDARQRVYIALYQSHLPKLDETGVIEYDQHRGTIKPTAVLEQLTAYLCVDVTDSLEPEDAPRDTIDDPAETASESNREWTWNEYYLGLSALSLLTVLVVTFRLLPGMSAGSWPWLGALIGSAFGVSALVERL